LQTNYSYISSSANFDPLLVSVLIFQFGNLVHSHVQVQLPQLSIAQLLCLFDNHIDVEREGEEDKREKKLGFVEIVSR